MFIILSGKIFEVLVNKIYDLSAPLYCRVPARWGLQQTHPGLRAATRHRVKHLTRLFLVITYKKNLERNGLYIWPTFY